MRWFCVLLAAGVVVGSPWLAPREASGQSASSGASWGTQASGEIPLTSVCVTSVRPLDFQGAPASPVPEPSGAAVGLLASVFLIRRRRARLD
jgi:hypothetical protein